MRALQLIGWGKDAEFRDVAEPEPGPGEVLVRVGGAGACHSDLHLMHDFTEGMLPWSPPFTLGHENAGWVEAVGAGVHDLELGVPVVVYGPWGCGRCLRCREGMENYCERQATIGAAGGGLGWDGGMAPLLRVPSARHVVPLTSLSPVDAAPLTDAGLTPYHAIKRSLALLGPGSFAVVIGAGGLGHMATQILDVCTPTTVIAVDPRREALALVSTVGAAHTVIAGADTAAELRELTRGRGADLVLDLVGSDETLAIGAAVTRQLGHVTLVGLAGGTLPVSFFSPQYEVSVASTYWGSLPELMEVVALAEAGKIRAHVQQFSLEDAPRAYEAMRDGSLRGRAVIVP
ncbi:MAG: NAD(P)-dependent alcohol dehydrogenase [Acidimicrobiia bacterium]